MTDAVIFGGTGFVGQHLTRWLMAQGVGRITLADIAPPKRSLDHNSVRYVHCDVRQPIRLDGAGRSTVVFNLAAIHRTPGHDDHEYFDTNVTGAHQIVEFCESADVHRLFFTSSIAVYGPTEQATTEASPPTPTIAYGKSKLEAERIQADWARRQAGRRLIIVRPGTVFGSGENGNFTRLATALAKRRFVYPGRRDTIKACGYVEDLIESMAFAEALASPTITYNFGFAKPPTIEEVCTAFCQVGGYSQPRLVAPERLMVGVAKVMMMLGASNFDPRRVAKLVHSTHIVPQVLIDEGYHYRFDLRGALADWYAGEPKGRFT